MLYGLFNFITVLGNSDEPLKKSWHKSILFICSSVLFADPTEEEENLLSGIVTIVVTDDDKIAAFNKPGNFGL